jgi:ribosomal-protein-alanine N-acetyltransferase
MFSVIKIASETLTEQYSPSLFNYFYESTPDLFLVAEYLNKIIGFAIAVRIAPHIARIVMISVLPEYQRQKTGTILLNMLIKKLKNKNISKISLEVRTDNIKAISFYRNHQFEIIDTMKQFYQNGEDAFIMQRVFQPC